MLSSIRAVKSPGCPRHISGWPNALCPLVETVNPQWLELHTENEDSATLEPTC